jgi:glucose-1-phosphate cytidylyltransferase
MKAVILAGGFGTRISEETAFKPKPMVEIGGRPILWHIMKTYSSHGIDDFVICCGYKGYTIKEYFSNYGLHEMSDVTFDLSSGELEVHRRRAEPWRVTLVDTGENTMTGGRLKRVSHHLRGETEFCFTYGDGVGNVDVTALVGFHRSQRVAATVTAAYPPGRFGAIHIRERRVRSFSEKPRGDGGLVNAGFFVLSPGVLELLEGDDTVWERGPLEQLVDSGQLAAYRHEGFWQPMDTLRDRVLLEELWASGRAPWKVWS